MGVYRATPELVFVAREQYRHLMPVWARCMMTKEFPNYPDRVMDADVPRWALRLNETQFEEGFEYEYAAG